MTDKETSKYGNSVELFSIPIFQIQFPRELVKYFANRTFYDLKNDLFRDPLISGLRVEVRANLNGYIGFMGY